MSDYCKKCNRPFDSGDDAIEVCDCDEQSSLAATAGSARKKASAIMSATTIDHRYVKRLRKIGASNYEIAQALGISEDSPVFHE